MHLRLPVKVEEIDSDDRSDISPETVVEIYKKQMIKIYYVFGRFYLKLCVWRQ